MSEAPGRRAARGSDPERYAAFVLSCVEQVPAGRVTTYGAVAELLRELTGTGGPRTVARVMATEGAPVPWWRCVRADGTLPEHLAGRARTEHLLEGTPLRPDGRVDLRGAFVEPDEPVELPEPDPSE